MEYGSFQNLRLSELDFTPQSVEESREPEKSQEFKKIEVRSRAKTTTSSFEALMSQNEDLAARLKVALRRLTDVESEMKNALDENDDLRATYLAMQDQLLIWKEKEKIWKEKELNSEEDLRKSQWQAQIDRDTLTDRNSSLQSLKTELERHKRYHEKIQKVVKPYIQQLKDFTKTLESENKNFRSENDSLQSKVRGFEDKLLNLRLSFEKENEFLVLEKNQLVEIFENERRSLKADLNSYVEEIDVLKKKTDKMDRVLERHDELENLVVVLRRSKEEIEKHNQEASHNIREALVQAKNQVIELEMKLTDTQNSNDRLQKELESFSQKNLSINEQMTTLRFLWSQKSEENEKLRTSLESLERINCELSGRLNDLRPL